MLDSDLAALFGVEARVLNQAVARNRKRFPSDFMFQLSSAEYESLRSQTPISRLRGGSADSSQSVMSSFGPLFLLFDVLLHSAFRILKYAFTVRVFCLELTVVPPDMIVSPRLRNEG